MCQTKIFSPRIPQHCISKNIAIWNTDAKTIYLVMPATQFSIALYQVTS